MLTRPYRLAMPARRETSVVFASPHSGRAYPAAFLRASVLDSRTLRSSEDAFMDRLLEGVTDFGTPMLSANMPRAFVDLNRAPDEFDPALIEDVGHPAHNPRISSGLGVVPRVVAGGRAIYQGKMPRREAESRVARWWHPYHATLTRLLAEAQKDFGQSILVDMHSMPHEAIDALAYASGRLGMRRPEVVIGDRYGSSAGEEVVAAIEAAFTRIGLCVVRNTPFAGAYILQTYGRPVRQQHAIQIEIDRALYMNEREVRPNGNFEGFRAQLTGVLAEVAAIGRPQDRALAAE